MQPIADLLATAQLDDAITSLQEQIRSAPHNTDLRALLIELLCISDELERADEQLAFLMKHHPQLGIGSINLRQLVRAQQTRRAFHRGETSADQFSDSIVSTAGAELEALLALHLHRASADTSAAAEAAAQLEQLRQPAHFCSNAGSGEIRDCDDSLNGFLEGLGADGKYYLWPWHSIERLEFFPPATAAELVWRRAAVVLCDGRQGELFIPITYINNQTPQQQLGRETDWQEVKPALITGLGQKMLLLGDTAIAITAIEQLVRSATANPDVSH